MCTIMPITDSDLSELWFVIFIVVRLLIVRTQ